MEGDRIHLSLDDIDFTALRYSMLREMEAIEDRALIEDMRSRGVQVFREGTIEDTSSKCDDMPHTIGDRIGNPCEKLIPSFADKNTRIDEKLGSKSFFFQVIVEITWRSGTAKLEFFYRLI
jgi:hypothetical protein